MVVAAMCVGLPDLNQGIGDRHPLAIEDTPLETNSLPSSFRLGQHVSAGVLTQKSWGEEWAHRLRGGQGKEPHGAVPPDPTDSNGVAYGPRATMFQRYPSAHSGSVTS